MSKGFAAAQEKSQPPRSALTDPVRYPSGAASPVLAKRAFLLRKSVV